MKKLNNIDQLDALFKSKLEHAEVSAPQEVWSQVSSSIGGSTAAGSQGVLHYLSSVTNVVKVALFVGGISAASILLYQANSSEDTTQGSPEADPIEQSTEMDDQTVQADPSEENNDSGEGVVQPITPSTDARDQMSNSRNPESPATIDRVETTGQDQNNIVPPRINDALAVPIPNLEIYSASHSACAGDNRLFTSSNKREGNWYVNGVLVKENSAVLSHRFETGGQSIIMLVQKELRAVFEVVVEQPTSDIIVTEKDGQIFELRLGSEQLEVKEWYVNGQLRSTEQILTSQFASGPVVINVLATDGNCNVILNRELEVKTFKEPVLVNIFTPDGDGLNDTYYVDIENYKSFRIQVFDRAGNRVFESLDPAVAWNGRVNNVGPECPEGQYTVVVQYDQTGNNPKNKNILITLAR